VRCDKVAFISKRRCPQEPQARLVLELRPVLDQQVDKAAHAEERVGDVVGDVGSRSPRQPRVQSWG